MKILFLVHDCITVPLGVSYLAALAREKGHRVKALSLTGRSIEQTICEYQPDIIAFGSTTGFHRHYLKLVKPIRAL